MNGRGDLDVHQAPIEGRVLIIALKWKENIKRMGPSLDPMRFTFHYSLMMRFR